VGAGAVTAWRSAQRPDAALVARTVLAVAVGGTGVWAGVLLARSPEWLPWLRPLVVVAAVAAAVGVVLPLVLPTAGAAARAFGLPVAGLALAAGLAAPLASSVQTAATAHSGALPSAGPAVTGGSGPGGRGGLARGPLAGGPFAGPFTGPGGGPAGGTPPAGAPAFGPGRQGGLGGLLDASTPDTALVDLLRADTTSRWAAAAVGSNSAAGVQLASGRPVMAIGGFNGSDPSPTLEEFQAYVAEGQVHYFLSSGSGGRGLGPGGGGGTSSAISAWVAQTFASSTVGGVTVYDLTQPASGAARG
jgi:hypothetical protein